MDQFKSMMSSIVLLLGHLLGAQDNYVEATHWLYFYTSAFFISVVLVVRSLFTAVLDSAYSAEEEHFYGTRTFLCVFSSFLNSLSLNSWATLITVVLLLIFVSL